MRWGTAVESALYTGLGGVLLLFGAGVPVHFKASSRPVLEAAGAGTETVTSLAWQHLDAGRVGPAQRLWQAASEAPPREAQARVAAMLEQHPAYRWTGGPDPYFDQFLQGLGERGLDLEPPPEGGRSALVDLLVPRRHRAELLTFLGFSSNATLQAVLATRAMTGTTRFMPVSSAAGHPLDASILTAALLVLGDHFPPEVLRPLKALAVDAAAGDPAAIDRIETVYFSLLALGKRLDWLELAELARHTESLESLEGLAVLARRAPGGFALVYAAVLLAEEAGPLTRYLGRHGETGRRDLATAVAFGRGAVRELLDRGEPIYEPPNLVRVLDAPVRWVRASPLVPFTLNHPGAALNLKFLAFLAAGYALSLALGNLFEGDLRRGTLGRLRRARRGGVGDPAGTGDGAPGEPGAGEAPPPDDAGASPISRLHPLVILANTALALLFGAVLWALMEPRLLRFGEEEPSGGARLVFDVAAQLDFIKPDNLDQSAMLDQATILTLVIFFLLQGTVYIACLIKVTEIKKKKNPPPIKMKLLENEENLFDLGLYVGLGGTVVSLIMLALEIKQASLIAAYSSTLFGIIFVAALKIFHVRPFRRELIIQCEFFSYEQEPPVDHL